MYSKRKRLNIIILIMIGVILLTNVASIIANMVVARSMGPEGLMMISTLFSVVGWIETVALIVLLVVMLISELKNGEQGLFKGIAVINLILFFTRWMLGFWYGIHIRQVVADQTRMLFECEHLGEYFGTMGMISMGISIVVFIIIGALAIVTLAGNSKFRDIEV